LILKKGAFGPLFCDHQLIIIIHTFALDRFYNGR
jgi:hypothetical protein